MLDILNSRDQGRSAGEIDKGISDIRARLEVDTEVHEVVLAKAKRVKKGLQTKLR